MANIPSQDELVSYLQTTVDTPTTQLSEDLQVDAGIVDSPFKSNVISSAKARRQARRDIKDLQMLTGENFNIIV